jgi:hypothetical protein
LRADINAGIALLLRSNSSLYMSTCAKAENVPWVSRVTATETDDDLCRAAAWDRDANAVVADRQFPLRRLRRA